MALGASNKQQMQPAQYVSAVNADGLFRPGNYSNPNFNSDGFRPQETMSLVQNQMQQTTKDNFARQALQDAEPWAVLERMQSVLEKSQPNLERIKYNRAMDMQSLLNSEVTTVNELYKRAYKGDANAQKELANFTFRAEVLEGASLEQYSALRDQLNKAQLSAANSTIIASSNTVKKDFAEMVQKLTSENNPDSKYVQAVISSAVVNSNAQNRALTLQETEAITAAINGYKTKYPKSKAVDTNIVDRFKDDLEGADKQMLNEQLYGDGRLNAMQLDKLQSSTADMLKVTTDPEVQRQLLYQYAQTLQASGRDAGPLLRSIMDMGMTDEQKAARAKGAGAGAGAVMQDKLK